jgi:hypothetical protein
LVLCALAILSTDAGAQIGSERLTGFLNKQPYKIYFWFDSLGGNPYDLNCPPHFRTIRLAPQSLGSGVDSTFLLRSHLQSSDTVIYYFVPTLADESSDLLIPGQTIRLLSSEKPFAPTRLDALNLQQAIDTATYDLLRYNALQEKAKRSTLKVEDYFGSILFFGAAVLLFTNTNENGKVSGDVTALGAMATAGGIYAAYRTMTKLGRYNEIKREIAQLEITLSAKF